MNQGNDKKFRGDDGVWQDGCIIFNFPKKKEWHGVFLSFQSQSFKTDDATGHAV
jgi:uncharacterized protein YukJ